VGFAAFSFGKVKPPATFNRSVDSDRPREEGESSGSSRHSGTGLRKKWAEEVVVGNTLSAAERSRVHIWGLACFGGDSLVEVLVKAGILKMLSRNMG